MLDLLIQGGTIVSPESQLVADVAVSGEQIAAITVPGTFTEAKRVVDARGKYVIPGGIDPHVHFNMPWGPAFMQSWEHGTTAAACGGTTTVIDFAWVANGTSAWDTVEKRVNEAQGRAAIDFALHACLMGPVVSPETVSEIRKLSDNGIVSFKIYMTYDFGVDDGGLHATMRASEAAGATVLVHAESHHICEWFKQEYIRRGQNSGRFVAKTRPGWVEGEAIQRAAFLADRTHCPLYVVHMSSREGIRSVYEARNRGITVIGETCPQYLFFTSQDVTDREDGLRYVNFPPLKEAQDRDALWTALSNATLSTVGTDDATTPVEEREKMGTTLDNLQAGFSGVETRLPLLYSEGVAKGRLSINRLVEITSANAAKLFGLYPQKGVIAVGSDADIVVLDPDADRTIRVADLHGWQDYTVYEGWRLRGYPAHVVSRGQLVAENGQYVGRAGHGQFVARKPGGALAL